MSEDWEDEADDLEDVADDWEDEEDKEAEREKELQERLLREKAEKERKEKEKQERIAHKKAMLGEAADEEEVGELDAAAQKKVMERQRMADLRAEMAGTEEADFQDRAVEKMDPATREEYEICGNKLGELLGTYRSAKHFPHAIQLLLMRIADRLSQDDIRELQRKLNTIAQDRVRDMKEEGKKKQKDAKKAKGKYEDKEAAAAEEEATGGAGCRNDLLGDDGEEFEFM
eukprot:TRINITY_DN3340_c0_g2_i3.p2 TRINITY_DN3340_c0_g2~~TRINITY_DN3340_c0_g2_i3.p2  ORF type:complete len:229 (+),score=128.74 TRINITY_DN3340_c0_g2_i3:91-777(+)